MNVVDDRTGREHRLCVPVCNFEKGLLSQPADGELLLPAEDEPAALQYLLVCMRDLGIEIIYTQGVE